MEYSSRQNYGVRNIFRMLTPEEQLHCRNVANYIAKILDWLNAAGYPAELPAAKVRGLAVFHDVGKAYIPQSILQKPGKLTAEEMRIVRRHTEYGKGILEDEKLLCEDRRSWGYLDAAIDMAYCHHERWDGSGYPNGRKGNEIPLLARVCAVADVYDAMLSPRAYKVAFPPGDAMDVLKEGAGRSFDPDVVKICADHFICMEEKEEDE